MSRLDFEKGIEELNRIGIIRITTDHYMEPRRRGSNFFVKSPISTDRTASLALYPSSNRFCDFAGGNKSGDVVGLYAYIKNCNQWQALQELSAYYGLSGRQQDKKKPDKEYSGSRQRKARELSENKRSIMLYLAKYTD